MWTADPAIPIEYDEKMARHTLITSADTRLVMLYCPFCGKKMSARTKADERREHSCKHLPDLSREGGSSIIYVREYREYQLLSRDSPTHSIRLFYCPICGSKQRVSTIDWRFYKKSPKEVAELRECTHNITTMQEALERFGPPDVERGSVVRFVYPEAQRTALGHERAFFYEHLAKTVDVVVIEGLDGRVDVRLYPKERKPHKRSHKR